jgi:hypothetical protein
MVNRPPSGDGDLEVVTERVGLGKARLQQCGNAAIRSPRPAVPPWDRGVAQNQDQDEVADVLGDETPFLAWLGSSSSLPELRELEDKRLMQSFSGPISLRLDP